MIVNEYLSPSYPGIVARRYFVEESGNPDLISDRLEHCAKRAKEALDQLFEGPNWISKISPELITYVVGNHQGVRFKISYDEFPDLIDLSAILSDGLEHHAWESICDKIGITPKHELLSDVAQAPADQIIMPLFRLLIGAWDAGEPDTEMLEIVKYWLQNGNPMVFCNLLGLLQLALNYFETLLPLIEKIAATEEMQTSEFVETIQYLISSAKTDLAEFEAYDLERQAIDAVLDLDA